MFILLIRSHRLIALVPWKIFLFKWLLSDSVHLSVMFKIVIYTVAKNLYECLAEIAILYVAFYISIFTKCHPL